MRVLGLDIGGANTKAALVEGLGSNIRLTATAIRYLPFWRGGRDALPHVLRELTSELIQGERVECIAVTMTAELSDVFQSKREGVEYILGCVTKAYGGVDIRVLDSTGSFRSVDEALKGPLEVAGANWAATARLLTLSFRDCLMIDVGSTTTDIIPITEGRVTAEGKNDLERLATGELIYTGALRSSVATVVDSIPVLGRVTRVAAEPFALTGDVHLLLGNITPREYSTETADGRGTSKVECLSRLARIVCSDLSMLGEDEVLKMASYIYERQLEKICDGIRQVSERLTHRDLYEVPVVTAGLGGGFLGGKAASRVGFKTLYSLEEEFGRDGSIAAPAVSTASLAALEAGGES